VAKTEHSVFKCFFTNIWSVNMWQIINIYLYNLLFAKIFSVNKCFIINVVYACIVCHFKINTKYRQTCLVLNVKSVTVIYALCTWQEIASPLAARTFLTTLMTLTWPSHVTCSSRRYTALNSPHRSAAFLWRTTLLSFTLHKTTRRG